MFIVRSEEGYLSGYDEDSTDEEQIGLIFADRAAEALVIENEGVAIIAAAFVGGDVVELDHA